MRNYLKLLKFLAPHKIRFSWAVFLIILSSLFEGVQLSFMIPMIDRIFTNKPIILPNKVPEFLEKIIAFLNSVEPQVLFWWVPFSFLFIFILKQVILFASDYLMNDIAQSVMRDVRSRLFERIQTLSLDYFSKKRTGELISRITNDVSAIENGISYGLTDLFKQPFLIIVFVSLAFLLNTKGLMILFIMFPLIGWPMALISKKLRKLSKGVQEKMADITSLLIETIAGVRILKAFSTEKYEIQRFRQKNQDFYRLRMKSLFNMNLTGPVTEIVGACCAITVLLILGNQVLKQQLSFGVFSLSFAAILQIIRPMKKMSNVQAVLQQALVANERIYEVLDTKPSVVEKTQPIEFDVFKNKIVLENVRFSYDVESGEVLKGIDLTINRGELVAVVGPTGSGKSTLVNLIPRFYDPNQGRVTLDDIDVKELSFKALRSQIGIVTQETILFNDTVKNNVSYGTFDATDDQVKQAVRMANAEGFIEQMPKGYDTVIGDRGFRLSGGEKQRLTIARAILKNPPILILDEATSSLDSESEKFVQQALDELMKERTVIAIAHRLSTIMKADKILVLQHGEVVGLGKHDDLLFSCPLYRRLYETQFQLGQHAG